ncbi:nitrate reductase molybdenum cofactor assembly chaperone [Pelomicrobium sp.]|jgi:nitrate reductase delta subunit|uniref:nitrate reductase molybdenum cofactor assembly chaperone n=1 Tax=Pelomicrobium sp. TaxID=2815319 RepID=UPI002FDD3C71
MKTYQVLGSLLGYPDAALIQALPELAQALEGEALLPRDERARLLTFMAELQNADLLELQERYVGLFDRGRAVSLHLFEHVHGESRDRGQAMVDLKRLYASKGLRLVGDELPDYLPAFLEYLSQCEPGEARALLQETAHVLAVVHHRLGRRSSPYATVFSALLTLAGANPLGADVRDEAPDESSPQALDAAWAEEPVTFGPEAVSTSAVVPFCGRPQRVAR